jgi:hypothetical protein
VHPETAGLVTVIVTAKGVPATGLALEGVTEYTTAAAIDVAVPEMTPVEELKDNPLPMAGLIE